MIKILDNDKASSLMHAIDTMHAIKPAIEQMMPARGFSMPLALHLYAVMLMRAKFPDMTLVDISQWLLAKMQPLHELDELDRIENVFTEQPDGTVDFTKESTRE